MQRRNFLGLIAAGAAYPLLPAVASPAPALTNRYVWTAATLTAEMEKMFACRMGPAMAFFEVIKGTDKLVEPTPDDKERRLYEPLPLAEDRERFIYSTYGFAVEGGDAWEAEHRLAHHFYTEFSKLDNQKLVWRRKPTFTTEEVVEFGDVWATSTNIEDGIYKLADKPQNVEYDFPSDSYRYVKRRYPLHRMTMRLVFTDADRAVPNIFARQEGVPLPRI